MAIRLMRWLLRKVSRSRYCRSAEWSCRDRNGSIECSIVSTSENCMAPQLDWLSHLLEMITVTGQLEIRCAYGAPWRIAYGQSAAREIPYHVVLKGVAILEDPEDESSRELGAGDIVLLPHGSAHVLHDGSGRPPSPAYKNGGVNLTVSENAGTGERLDMLCGRFFIAPPHDRLIRAYLPTNLVVRATGKGEDSGAES